MGKADSTPMAESSHAGGMFGRNFIQDVRSGATRGVAQATVNWLFSLLVPTLVTTGAVVIGVTGQLEPFYIFVGASITFGAVAMGLNQLSTFNNRLREKDGLVAGPIIFQQGLADGRHDFKPILCIIVPIHNRFSQLFDYRIEKSLIVAQNLDGTARRENLKFAGERDGIVPPFDVRRIQVPAVIVDDLLKGKKFEGNLDLTVEFGHKNKKHTLSVKRKLIATKQKDESWTFESYGS